MIFQDPISSLNPRRRVRDIVAEPLDIWGRGTKQERATKVRRDARGRGDRPRHGRRPSAQEFSGGQCQRISIARALMAEPDLLICDEPVSALDVSVQAQILNLLADLKERFGLTMVFIAHDLAVVKNVSDRMAVMYLGKLVRDRRVRRAVPFGRPSLHRGPPGVDPRARPRPGAAITRRSTGELPSPLNPPSGCRFRTRCPYAQELCAAAGAAAAGARVGPPGGLPFPADRRGRSADTVAIAAPAPTPLRSPPAAPPDAPPPTRPPVPPRPVAPAPSSASAPVAAPPVVVAPLSLRP